jgi:hypothetical protein
MSPSEHILPEDPPLTHACGALSTAMYLSASTHAGEFSCDRPATCIMENPWHSQLRDLGRPLHKLQLRLHLSLRDEWDCVRKVFYLKITSIRR